MLIEVDGVEKVDKLLAEEPEAIHKRMRPHAEQQLPPPPGIDYYVPNQEERAAEHVPAAYAGLMAGFHMPVAEE